MKDPKHVDFNDRLNSAATARQEMLKRFAARPAEDDPQVIARREARQAVAAARDARQAERETVKRQQAERLAAEKAAQQIRNAEQDIMVGDNTFRFFQLSGDFDGDGRVDP